MKKSENEILQDAQRAKAVIDAIYGLLESINQKTGFDQARADAESRFKAAEQQAAEKAKELADIESHIVLAKNTCKAAVDKASKVMVDAEAKASDTRMIAATEAALIIKKANGEATALVYDAGIRATNIDIKADEKQKEVDALQSKMDAITKEYSEVNGKLLAAKDEIRRKFLN